MDDFPSHPESDIHLSRSSSNPLSQVSAQTAQVEGDLNYTTDSGSTSHETGHHAFLEDSSSERIQNLNSNFAQTNLEQLDENRDLKEVHLMKLIAKKDKTLNQNLKNAAALTDEEWKKARRRGSNTRQDECNKILLTWKDKFPQPVKVADLKKLLKDAAHFGGDDKMYDDIIHDIVNYGP